MQKRFSYLNFKTLTMKTNFKKFFTIGLATILFSCGNSKKESIRNKYGKEVKELVAKYNADTIWDATFAYTSYYQKKFIEQNKLMLFRGRIYDIIKVDSNYVVKVMDEREDAALNFLALITFTPEQLNATWTNDKLSRGVFVIKVTKITSSNPSIKEDEASDGDDNTYTYTHLSDDADRMITIVTGKMVDCSFKKVDDNH